MDAKTLFERCIDQADHCLKNVQKDQLDNSTPCSEWNLKTLVNHIVNEVLWVTDLLAGKTISEVGSKYDGDLVGTTPYQAWQKAAEAARKAVEIADLEQVVHLSYGDVSAEHYISEIASDMLIHTWDVDQSIKCSLRIDDDVAQAIYDLTLPKKDEMAGSGLFGEPLNVPADAAIRTKLLALFGRRELRQV